MEATLCLRLPRAPAAIKPHCLLTTRQRFLATPPAFHRSGFSSMSSNGGSIKADLNHFHKLVSAYSVPPPPPPVSGNGRVRNVVVVGAGVVLACLVGVLCSNMKHGPAHAFWHLPMSQSPSPGIPEESQEKTPEKSKSVQEKSMDVLTEIFVSRSKGGNSNSATLLSLLRDKVGDDKLSKDYLNLLEPSDRGNLVNKLQKEWEKNARGSEEKYELGLLLIDVYLNQGDYQKAKNICDKMEILKYDSDIRYSLRKDISEKCVALKNKYMEEKIIAKEVLKMIEDIDRKQNEDWKLRAPPTEDTDS